MRLIRLPSKLRSSHPAPRGPALLLSCMDLRLLDEIVSFMDQDGLNNRYDHVILAGAALGAVGGGLHPGWEEVFLRHLDIAVALHHIKDVYIIEHRDCGAYREFLGDKGDFDDSEAVKEFDCHKKYAKKLQASIKKWVKDKNEKLEEEAKKKKWTKNETEKKKIKLHVKAFLMDLRGKVSLLY